MSTITTTSYRKTKSGEWVVYGPARLIHAGQIAVVITKAGRSKQERIARTGKPFVVGGEEMVYGYLGERDAQPARAEAHNAHFGRTNGGACITGGNCSSFGRGRSCGGYDCDGF